jgi:hypothetical protein
VPASGQSSPEMMHSISSAHREQTLPVAAAELGEELLHNLDILFDAH